jgi:hypothetical protein
MLTGNRLRSAPKITTNLRNERGIHRQAGADSLRYPQTFDGLHRSDHRQLRPSAADGEKAKKQDLPL